MKPRGINNFLSNDDTPPFRAGSVIKNIHRIFKKMAHNPDSTQIFADYTGIGLLKSAGLQSG
jgi:hypothetical protein